MDALEKEYFDEIKDEVETQGKKIDLILSHLKIEYEDEDYEEDEDDEEDEDELIKTKRENSSGLLS